MTDDEKKWTAVVAKLLEKTLDGTLQWSLRGPYVAPYAVCRPVEKTPHRIRIAPAALPVAIMNNGATWYLPYVDGTHELVDEVWRRVMTPPPFAEEFAAAVLADAERRAAWEASIEGRCHASRGDGECNWEKCPQLRDGEPGKSGRHCPLDCHDDEE